MDSRLPEFVLTNKPGVKAWSTSSVKAPVKKAIGQCTVACERASDYMPVSLWKSRRMQITHWMDGMACIDWGMAHANGSLRNMMFVSRLRFSRCTSLKIPSHRQQT